MSDSVSWIELTQALDRCERWIAEMRQQALDARQLVTDLAVEQQRAEVFARLEAYLAALTLLHQHQQSPDAYDAVERVRTMRNVDVAERALRVAFDELHRREVELIGLRKLLTPTGDALPSGTWVEKR